MKKYEPQTIEEGIIMDALDLAKAHTRWKTGKGSVWSFSRSKDKFVKSLREWLILTQEMYLYHRCIKKPKMKKRRKA